MNIEQAKAIPMSEILEKIGRKPTKSSRNELWYLSPFREETTPSFHINVSRNVWYDFGEGVGGDTVAFACHYLKSHKEHDRVTDGLRWLNNMAGFVPTISKEFIDHETEQQSALQLKNATPLTHPLLIKYLEGRGIPMKIARKYLHELELYNKQTKRYLYAIGLRNEDGGYEVRNQFIKSCIKPKAVTFIRGTVPKPEGINLFEGMMDFLSVISRRDGKPLEDDTIILNSLSQMKDASAYIKNYGYREAYTWFDNDAAGAKACEAFDKFFETEKDLQHRPMNSQYAPYKDVNAWHMSTPNP